MPTFQTVPVTVEAVRFTGENWAEMHEFTGHAVDDGTIFGDGRTFDVFIEDSEGFVRLFVAAIKDWKIVDLGDWIVQGPGGFTPWKDQLFKMNFVQVEEPANG